MKPQVILVMGIALLLSSGVEAENNLSALTLKTPSGYETSAWLNTPAEITRDTGIVFIHGKKGSPKSPQYVKFMSKMTKLGYAIIAPQMPWSEARGYQGTRLDGQEIIQEAVKAIPAKQIVIIGHSMGAMAILQFGVGRMPSKVIGLVAVSPGHDPNISNWLRDRAEDNANKACKMVAEGRGKAFEKYPEGDDSDPYEIQAAAEYYCTFYSTDKYPDTRDVVKKITTPLFWLAGDSDRLAEVYSYQNLYHSLPANTKHTYAELEGGHTKVLFRHVDVISRWIESL